MDIEVARENMIKQQIRTWDVTDHAILSGFNHIRREDFVAPQQRALAYADVMLPIGHDETMLLPSQEARILQALNIRRDETILEVGTGSGFFTALLAHHGHYVYSVDIYPDFIANAQQRLDNYHLKNVQLLCGDAAKGWEQNAPYDVTVITGSLPALPLSFRQHLNIGGRLFAVIGCAPAMSAILIKRTAEDAWQQTTLFTTVIKRLVNAPQPHLFAL